MTTYKHIVHVHPVHWVEPNPGWIHREPNLHKVLEEHEFDTEELADLYIKTSNNTFNESEVDMYAVYYGRVNDATGELE